MKNLLNLGKALNKAEQKQIQGGSGEGEECVCINWVTYLVDGITYWECSQYAEFGGTTHLPLAPYPTCGD